MMGFLTDLVSYRCMVVNPRPLARTVHAKRTMLRIPPVLRADGYYAYLQSKVTVWKAEFRQLPNSTVRLAPDGFIIQAIEKLPKTVSQLIAWQGRDELTVVVYIQKIIRAVNSIQSIVNGFKTSVLGSGGIAHFANRSSLEQQPASPVSSEEEVRTFTAASRARMNAHREVQPTKQCVEV